MNKFTLIMEAAEKAIAAEFRRTQYLLGKAERLAAAVIIVVGYQLWDVRILLESSSPWVRGSSYMSLLVLGLSLFFAFWAMRTKGQADYPRGNKLLDNLKPQTVSEAEAQEALIQLLLTAREQNARLNDAKSKSLSWAGWLLFLGVLMVAGGQMLDAIIDV